MAYFVTGATGFIGQFLVRNLLKRGQPIYVLVRKGSVKKLDALREEWGADEQERHRRRRRPRARRSSASPTPTSASSRARSTTSSTSPRSTTSRRRAEAQQEANVDGTRHAVQFAQAVDAGCFHHVSSIAAAGLYDGVFREDMFEEAEDLDHPYFKTKHDSEGVVRDECKRPFRIYRPGFVVGDSKTGYIDKIDGPYYFFKFLQKMRDVAAAVDADDRHRRRAHQHRAGRLRRRRARLPRAQEGPRRQVLPPDRPGAAPHRRGAQHLRQGRPRAADDDAPQRAHVRLHPGADPLRHRLAGAGQAHGPRRAARTSASRRTCSSSSTGRRATTTARRRRRSRAPASSVPAARDLRAEALGLLGAQPRSRPLHRPQPVGPREGQGHRRHRRLVGHRQGDRDQARGRRRAR